MAVMDYIGDEQSNDVDNPNPTQPWNADGRAGNDDLTGGSVDDLLIGGDNDDTLHGGDGVDLLDGDGAYRPEPTDDNPTPKTAYYRGSDTLYGEGGNDVLAGGSGDDFLYGGGDDDLLGDFSNLTEYDVATGTYRIFDEPEADELGALFGGVSDNDTLDGGSGDDVIVSLGGTDIIRGDIGIDRLAIFRGDRPGPFGPISGPAITIDIADGGGGRDIGDGTTIAGIEQIAVETGGGVDSLAGGARADVLSAGGGDDFLYGRGGADDLDGGAGADTMDGGAGDDSYVVDDAGDVIIETRLGGVDSVESSVDFSALVGSRVYLENITLTGSALVATGNALNNVIVANGQNNTLNGYVGADTLTGGFGNDTYVVDNVGDQTIEVGETGSEQGVDTVLTLIDWTLGANIENLTVRGAGAIDVTGNDLNNVITGGGGANVITGGLGADILSGRGGEDQFVYTSVADSTRSNYDRIRDFDGNDRLILTDVDANSTLEGDQDFAIVDAFSRAAGELTIDYIAGGNYTQLLGDTNGDGRADFRIVLLGDQTANLADGFGLAGAGLPIPS